MSKTYQIINGAKVMVRAQKGDRHERKRKFMGHTSGQHSHGVYDHTIEDGKIVYTKTDRAPIKGIDFIKYGYPFQTQHKKVVKNKIIIKELDIEIKNYGN